jgi:hypothetical protein
MRFIDKDKRVLRDRVARKVDNILRLGTIWGDGGEQSSRAFGDQALIRAENEKEKMRAVGLLDIAIRFPMRDGGHQEPRVANAAAMRVRI